MSIESDAIQTISSSDKQTDTYDIDQVNIILLFSVPSQKRGFRKEEFRCP